MRLSLKAILPGLFGLIALIAVGQGIVTIVELARIRNGVSEVATDWLPSVALIGEISNSVDQVRIGQYRLVTASTDAQTLDVQRQLYAAALEKLADARKRYEPLITSPAERAIYDEFVQTWNAFIQSTEHLELLMSAGIQAEAQVELASPEVLKLYAKASETLARGVAFNRLGAQRNADASVAGTDSASVTAYIAVGIALLAALGAMVFSILRISRPITRITGIMSAVASGDVKAVVPYQDRRDEIGAMAARRAGVQGQPDPHPRSSRRRPRAARAGAEDQRRAACARWPTASSAAVGGIIGLVSVGRDRAAGHGRRHVGHGGRDREPVRHRGGGGRGGGLQRQHRGGRRRGARLLGAGDRPAGGRLGQPRPAGGRRGRPDRAPWCRS